MSSGLDYRTMKEMQEEQGVIMKEYEHIGWTYAGTGMNIHGITGMIGWGIVCMDGHSGRLYQR